MLPRKGAEIAKGWQTDGTRILRILTTDEHGWTRMHTLASSPLPSPPEAERE
jgi:hypothetical protein